MGYKGKFVQGEVPESGAIFMSNTNTKEECLDRKLFGLPSGMSNFVLNVKKGMTLFLFEFERRLLYGVFRATSDGEINIEPKAFRSSGKHFPAQVRFTTIWDCIPLAEHEFKVVITDNYYSKKKFNFGLNEKQVNKLMKLFRSNILSKNRPKRSISRYEDKSAEGNARSSDRRKDIRHRIRFDSRDFRGDEVKEVDDNDMYINKHIIESRQEDKRDGFLTHHTTENDEFEYCGRHDILGKHLDLREEHIKDEYIPVFSKPHGQHLDEIGAGSSRFLMDGENKDIIDYNRLQDEYNIREGFQPSLNEYPLTNHVLSHLNQNAYSNCDPTRIDVSDIRLSPCFDDGPSFIPIIDRNPERIPMSNLLPHYSHNEGPIQYLDDHGSQSSIFPKFISRRLSSSDADLCVREVDPTDDDKRFCGTHESKRAFGTGITNKRVSVFSRLSSSLRHKEHTLETDEKHELSSSVDKVMKMLEKVVSSPIKRTGRTSSDIKQDDDSNSADSKSEDYELSDEDLEAVADVAYEEVQAESAFQETRLVDFKRRKKSNKRIGGTSKRSSERVVGTTSDVGPVAIDQLTDVSHKRRKLVRPAFIKKNYTLTDGVSACENTLSENDSISTVVETSEKVDASIKLMEDVSMVPTCYEKAPDDSNSTKAGTESSIKVDASIKPIDLNMLPTSDDTKDVLESSEKVDVFIKASNTNILPTSADTKDVLESLEKVDVFIKASNTNILPTSDDTKDVLESSEKVDVFIKASNTNILPTSDESLPSKDDNNSTKSELEGLHMSTSECQKSGNRDGNAENRPVSDVFVEASPVTSVKDDEKMCGWIEW